MSPTGSSISRCWSCYVCPGLTYEIYSGDGPSIYVYCVVCYCFIAAPYVRSVVIFLHNITLLMMFRNAQWTKSSIYSLTFFLYYMLCIEFQIFSQPLLMGSCFLCHTLSRLPHCSCIGIWSVCHTIPFLWSPVLYGDQFSLSHPLSPVSITTYGHQFSLPHPLSPVSTTTYGHLFSLPHPLSPVSTTMYGHQFSLPHPLSPVSITTYGQQFSLLCCSGLTYYEIYSGDGPSI